MYCTKNITHTVKRGDTIYRIAKMHQTTVPDILVLNPGINPYDLQVGEELIICTGGQMDGGQSDDMQLNQHIRLAWEQLAHWTRMYLLSDKTNAADMESAVTRLNQIPSTMAGIFGKYYPADVTAKLQQALTSFVTNTINLVTAAKNNDSAKADDAERKLEQDVNNLSEILSNMNINYNKETLQKVLGEYVTLTSREIVGRVSGKFSDDIATFDEAEKQALKIADYLSSGIMNQFARTKNKGNPVSQSFY
jgi:hypothetical protein